MSMSALKSDPDQVEQGGPEYAYASAFARRAAWPPAISPLVNSRNRAERALSAYPGWMRIPFGLRG